jgi:carotenoid cleavage dioxygenase-like enzyme
LIRAAGRGGRDLETDAQAAGCSRLGDHLTGLPCRHAYAVPIFDVPDAACVVMGFVYDPLRGGSDLVILDAAHIAGPLLATVRLPRRVPQGFHGNWIPAASLSRTR